ncbi:MULTISPECIES: DUF6064 family protein [unclassified Arsukibacterium]|uniref:DUF6064 family protein n=1 Tax=unclassified Arsukibacterium TaxID=2635278 RepID=UPI000C3641CE|nr:MULTISPECIES: DUF6064 family protein [unclassified Arsukibacterium]MBM34586.1 MFS transporter permease [Rheinheimera sp.]|tara:strand:- start:42983 stop:43579 length:597 start_codon:yes stop_codon:yes gene_type:complete
MSGGAGYQLQQFIPFSHDVYLRLLERIGETYWPWHIATLLLGVLVLLLALRHQARAGSMLLAPLWLVVGVAFFLRHYAELNWAGNYIGYAFIAEAVLLLGIALSGKGLAETAADKRPAVIIGLILALTGLVGWPFIGLLSGDSWYQAAVFGIYADPTAIATLGLLLILLRGWLLWLSAIIPLLWLVVSGLTWWVLLNS